MQISQQISKLIPDGFSPEAQKIITAMVLENYSEARDLGNQVDDAVRQFESEYPALFVCPRCEGCGCSYCDFDGV